MTIGCSWEGAALPNPPAGGGMEEPGFPIPLRTGCALANPPTGGGMGEPGSPILTLATGRRVSGPFRGACPLPGVLAGLLR